MKIFQLMLVFEINQSAKNLFIEIEDLLHLVKFFKIIAFIKIKYQLSLRR